MEDKTLSEKIENKEIDCGCNEKGKCGKHYFNCEFCQQPRKECMCD